MPAAEILVVDDDEDIREFLETALSHEGFRVDVAPDGISALSRIRQKKPDVVILDFMMPEMTGEELCRTIKKDADLRDILVFIYSARSDVPTKLRCFENGADQYLVKPLDPREIATRVERFLKLKKPEMAGRESSQAYSMPGKSKYGPHIVEGLVGSGGMGQVYKGVDVLLERPVAIKVLSRQLSNSAEFVQRFRREAKLLASIDHPGIATIYTFGEEGGEHYFAMQWCSGGSLADRIQERKQIDVATALDYILQCSYSLAAAARKGVVHRDIKPSNLMFDDDGRLKLVDFGLAVSEKSPVHLTSAGEVVGTPLYMSPERATSPDVDLRADIYSLGITFYHMLYGKTPFSGSSAVEIMIQHATQPLPAFDDLGRAVPRSVYEVMERMTRKRPEDRYQDYDTLILDLLQIQESSFAQLRSSSAVLSEISEEELEEARYGPYLLESEVGSDTAGRVYKAYDGERFALVRVLSRECLEIPGFLQDLEHRIEILRQLNHPGIGTIYYFGEEAGDHYLAQEWCPEGSLVDLVRKKGRLAPAAAIALILQCVDALAAAHNVGILHGNLRPNNILLDQDQQIKIVDLAWANLIVKGRLQDRSGSFRFSLPESLNAPMDMKRDVHSLGLTFYYMLYGTVPAGEPDQVASLPPYDDLGGTVPVEVHQVLERMMFHAAAPGYPDYLSLHEDLKGLQSRISSAAGPAVPRVEQTSDAPVWTGKDIFGMLCRLYAEDSSGLLRLRWAVLETRLIVRRREIVLFESNQPGKNIWRFLAKARSIRKEDIPGKSVELETALRSLLEKQLLAAGDFVDGYHQLLKEVVDEIFIWPVCEGEFFSGSVENRAFTGLRISDVLLEAARSSINYEVIRNRFQEENLVRRKPMFDQLLSSLNMSRQESFLAFRIEGENTSLESLQLLTALPEEMVLRFVFLLEGIGAVEVRSDRS